MRVLGFLFLVVLVIAVIGLFRGWFTFAATSHAGESRNVTVGVNTDRMREDAAKLAALPERVAAQVRAMGKKVGADESEIEGTVTTADMPTRSLVVTSGTERLDMHVGSTVRIERAGESVTFDQLRPASRVRLLFRHEGEARKLARIDILDG